jgi:CDP-glucose 4,6-dehydratase
VENVDVTPLDVIRGRSVLVTGHTGFKGSWLCLALHRLGAIVHGLSLPPPTQPNHYELARIAALLRTEMLGDVRDAATVRQALQRANPDLVLHLAAQPIVRQGYEFPEETFATNILGTLHILEAVRQRRTPCVLLIVTSDKVYEPGKDVPSHREDDPLGGHDPYAASKAAAELVVQAYRRSFFPPEKLAFHGVKLASARAGNVIGGGDWAQDRIVPDSIRALTQNRPIIVRNPRAIRPWQHITDVVHAYLTLVATMCASDEPERFSAWNFGPPDGKDVRVADLVAEICAVWGQGSWMTEALADVPFEAPVLRLDSHKATSRLGVRTYFEPRQAIELTVRWYRAWHEGMDDMQGVSIRDLEAHDRARLHGGPTSSEVQGE